MYPKSKKIVYRASLRVVISEASRLIDFFNSYAIFRQLNDFVGLRTQPNNSSGVARTKLPAKSINPNMNAPNSLGRILPSGV
jgi:hypothetical protein